MDIVDSIKVGRDTRATYHYPRNNNRGAFAVRSLPAKWIVI